MKQITILLMSVIALLMQGCTASTISHLPNPDIRLSHHYSKIAIVTNGASGQSIGTTCLFQGQLSQTHVMDSSSQVQMAVETLAFECERLGFEVVANPENADLILEFNIGTVRFDPVAGWIADQGIAKFRDAKTNRLVAQYQAKTSFITPTVENILYKLVNEIKKNY